MEAALSAMDAVGVDRAVVDVLAEDANGYFDHEGALEYAAAIAACWPQRIALVARWDPRCGDVEAVLTRIAETSGIVAIRLIVISDADEARVRSDGYENLFLLASERGLPIMFMAPGRFSVIELVARRHPDLCVIVDHLGLPQPPTRSRDEPPLRQLAALLNLASFDNVAVKVIGLPALSDCDYPYEDVWPALHDLIEKFGVRRLMWGSDFTRLRGQHTYAELLHYVGNIPAISRSEREWLYGRTATHLLTWPLSDAVNQEPRGGDSASISQRTDERSGGRASSSRS